MPAGKKECPSCKGLVGTRISTCKCGHKFATKTKTNKINKHTILKRIVLRPEKDVRLFFKREMKILNSLCDRYSLEFMNIVNFGKQFDSLAYLASPKLKDTMDQKFRAFNYVVDNSKYPTYNIGEKFGEDKETNKRKTIRDFLDE